MKRKDISGKRYGKLTAISFEGKNEKGNSMWSFLCSGCDTVVTKRLKCVTRKRGIRSCGSSGCQEKLYDGMVGSKVYHAWKAMIARCENEKHPEYPRYGGRGIFVCSEWHDFNLFLRDMGVPEKDQCLDKIDNNDGYHKSNCRWVSKFVSNQNTRRCKTCVVNGTEYISVREAARVTGVPYSTLIKRLNKPPTK